MRKTDANLIEQAELLELSPAYDIGASAISELAKAGDRASSVYLAYKAGFIKGRGAAKRKGGATK